MASVSAAARRHQLYAGKPLRPRDPGRPHQQVVGDEDLRVVFEPRDGEVRVRHHPLVDLDLFGGILLPFRDSIFITGEKDGKNALNQKLGTAIGTFGMTLEAGTTF